MDRAIGYFFVHGLGVSATRMGNLANRTTRRHRKSIDQDQRRKIYNFTPIVKTDGSQPCSLDPEAWFEDDRHSLKLVKAICNGKPGIAAPCPFVNGCRLEGLLNREPGVWGGLSLNNRDRAGKEWREREIAKLRNLLALEGNLRALEPLEVAS